jgi:hypothetical protein
VSGVPRTLIVSEQGLLLFDAGAAPSRGLAAVAVDGGMLDHSDHPCRHEATDAHRMPGASEFGHLDDAPRGRDLDPSADPCRRYLKGLRAACTGVDDDLDAVSDHMTTVTTPVPTGAEMGAAVPR